MNCLKSLTLENFGKHKKLKIEFDPLLTVIQGESNSGKSTIFRALRLLTANRPASPERIFNLKHNKENKFKVILEKNGHKITRKNKTYIIDDNELKAFGSEVPEQVKNIISLKDINWQSQIINQYYLLFETPGSVARIINKQIGMEDSLTLINAVKGKLSKSKSDFNHYQQEIKEQKQIVDRLKPVEDLLKEAEKLKELEQEIFQIYESNEELEKLILDIEKTEIDLSEIQLIDDIYQEIQELEEIKDELIKEEEYINSFHSCIREIEKIQIIPFEKLNNIIKEIENLNKMEESKNELTVEIANMSKIIKEIETLEDEIKIGKKEQSTLEQKYNDELKELKICPFRNVACPLNKRGK